MIVTDEMRSRMDREVAKYPADQKQSAVMACLAIVQKEPEVPRPDSRPASPAPVAATARSY